MELNVNEPLTTCRKELSRRQNCRYFSRRQDNCNGQAGYSCPTVSFRRGLQVFRHLGGKNITQAFIRNVRGLLINARNAATRSDLLLPQLHRKLRLSLLPNRAIRHWDVVRSVGCIHSSVEISVMEMERRGTVIQV